MTWEPPLSDMCAGTQGSETVLQQGAPQPPEGRLHTLHTKTHTTARAAGQRTLGAGGTLALKRPMGGVSPGERPPCECLTSQGQIHERHLLVCPWDAFVCRRHF